MLLCLPLAYYLISNTHNTTLPLPFLIGCCSKIINHRLINLHILSSEMRYLFPEMLNLSSFPLPSHALLRHCKMTYKYNLELGNKTRTVGTQSQFISLIDTPLPLLDHEIVLQALSQIRVKSCGAIPAREERIPELIRTISNKQTDEKRVE